MISNAKLNKIAAQKGIRGNFSSTVAIVALGLVDKTGAMKLDPDDLVTSLANLLASAGAADAVAALVSASDLTASSLLLTPFSQPGASNWCIWRHATLFRPPT